MSWLSKTFKKVSGGLKKATGAIAGGLGGYLSNPSSPWLGALGGMAGGAADSYGFKKQNKAARKAAKISRGFNHDEAVLSRNHSAQQAQIQRSFQERMSSTSHQREINDLKAAGLNPILSAGGGGSSSPGGAMGATNSASSSQNPEVNELSSAAHSAAQLMTTKAQIRQINAQTALTKKQAQAIGIKSQIGDAGGSLLEYLREMPANTSREVARHYQHYKSQQKGKYVHGTVHNKGVINRKATAYPTEGSGSKSASSTGFKLVKPKTSKPVKKYINFKDFAIEYWTRMKNGVEEYKLKDTPWLSLPKTQQHIKQLKRQMQ